MISFLSRRKMMAVEELFRFQLSNAQVLQNLVSMLKSSSKAMSMLLAPCIPTGWHVRLHQGSRWRNTVKEATKTELI